MARIRYNAAAAACFRDTMDAILTLLQVFSILDCFIILEKSSSALCGPLVEFSECFATGFDSIGGIYKPLAKQNWFCFATRHSWFC